jgi:hypothetical protein
MLFNCCVCGCRSHVSSLKTDKKLRNLEVKEEKHFVKN